MEENKTQAKEFPLAGWIAILAALVVGVILIFAMLEMVMPKQWSAQVWDEMTVEKGQSGTYFMRMLTEEERESKEIRIWLERADEEDCACLLYRQENDEYVLYLPQQDRVLTLGDVTVSEEKDEDGETNLIIRARTAENSEEIDPEEQLFCIRTDSKDWRGIRIKVVLDGREKDVEKLVSKGDKLYSTEEVYIGRDVAE